MSHLYELGSPAVKAHLASQRVMMSDLYQHLFASLQKVTELQLQMTPVLLNDSMLAAEQILVAKNPIEVLSILVEQAQASAEKLRAYQQHMIDLGTHAHADLSKTAESHIPQATNTAQEVAKELVKKAAMSSDKAAQRQKEMVEKMASPLPAGNKKGNVKGNGRDHRPGKM